MYKGGFLGLPAKLCTVGGSETSHTASNFMAHLALHDLHNMDNMHDVQDVSFADIIDQAESIRFRSTFKTSATAGLQPTKLCTTEDL
jgi:hypothetical protein